MIDPEIKRKYNEKYRNKKKLEKEEVKQEEIKPIIKPKINKIIPKVEIKEPEEDDEEITEITEEDIENMVQQRLNFFLKQKNIKIPEKNNKIIKLKEPQKTEENSIMKQITQTIILMSVPAITKLSFQMIGSLLLKPIKPQLPPQQSTQQPQDIFITPSPFFT